MTLRVVIADDHPVFRHGLRAALCVDDALDIVGEVATADECVAAAIDDRADVVLMDLEMPGGGVEATAQLARQASGVRVLVLTMHDDGESLLDALRAEPAATS